MLDYDYLLIDVQHAPTDYATLAACLTAVNAAGKPALVRVEGPADRGCIQQALDLGAVGIMVPTVNSGEGRQPGRACQAALCETLNALQLARVAPRPPRCLQPPRGAANAPRLRAAWPALFPPWRSRGRGARGVCNVLPLAHLPKWHPLHLLAHPPPAGPPRERLHCGRQRRGHAAGPSGDEAVLGGAGGAWGGAALAAGCLRLRQQQQRGWARLAAWVRLRAEALCKAASLTLLSWRCRRFWMCRASTALSWGQVGRCLDSEVRLRGCQAAGTAPAARHAPPAPLPP